MKLKKYLPLIFFGGLIFLGACSSGKKALERGDYYDAVIKSIQRLRKNPDHKKSVATLKEGYPYAVEWLEKEAENKLASNAPFKWKQALGSYQKINRMHDEIKRAPGARRIISNPKNYFSKVAELKEKAAAESYDAGIAAMMKNTRQDAKQAYFLFQDANNFSPGYKEVSEMIQEAKFQATLKVIIEQIPVPRRYALSGDFFQDQVEGHLRTRIRNEFVRFYTPAEAKSEDLPYADQIIRIKFDDFVVGKTHTVERIKEITKDSVVVGQVTLEDGSKLDAYGTVKAKLTTFKKEVISKGLLSMQIVEAKSNAVLTHRKFDGEFVWYSEWGNYTGDERALEKVQMDLSKRKEVPPPPPQDLFIEFTKPIYGKLTNAIDSYYRKF